MLDKRLAYRHEATMTPTKHKHAPWHAAKQAKHLCASDDRVQKKIEKKNILSLVRREACLQLLQVSLTCGICRTHVEQTI